MVLESMAKGLTYKQTADQLGISIDTIRTYVRRIYEKLHVQSRTEAVAKVFAALGFARFNRSLPAGWQTK